MPEKNDDVEQIAVWLDGLERCLEDVIRISRDPDEVETMRRRRGIYSGIAAEVRGGNWRLAKDHPPKARK